MENLTFIQKLVHYGTSFLVRERLNGDYYIGYNNVRSITKTFNYLKNFSSHRARMYLYKNKLQSVLIDNGIKLEPEDKLIDGWLHIKNSNFPFHKEFLETGDEIFKRLEKNESTQKAYIEMINGLDDIEKYPNLLNFATSSELISVVANYLKCIPVLTEISFYISEPVNFDATGSQLFHIDIEDTRVVRLIVPIEEITEEHGPFSFLPESITTKAIKKLKYGTLKGTYRITDEQMYKHIAKDKLIKATCKRGDLVFADTSRCFHYGSRGQTKPRKLCMVNFHSDIPENFKQTFGAGDLLKKYIKPNDSELRKMLLDYSYYPGKKI